jgi:glycosyltransferase involved in cell wall biosynthesis
MDNDGRIRIAFCLDSFRLGGTELNAIRTIEALDHHRFDVSIFYLAEDGPLFERYQALELEMHHLPIRSLYGPSSFIQRNRFSKLLRQKRAQIVHTHCIYTNLFMAPVARLTTNSHVIMSRRWGRQVFGKSLSLANRVCYAFSHSVLANSQCVAQIVVESDRVPRHRIIVVPNFVDDSAFEATPASWVHRQRRNWGIADNQLVIGIVARLEKVKNHEMLLQAVAGIREQIHVVIVGGGSLMDSLANLATDLGIDDRVHFTGEIETQSNIHAAFDISVLCSNSEGFPNTIVEAMAAGRPVVATAVGGVSDSVIHNETGILVPRGDVNKLGEALQILVKEPDLRKSLGASGKLRVAAEFSRNRVIDNLSAVYESAATGRPEINTVIQQ